MFDNDAFQFNNHETLLYWPTRSAIAPSGRIFTQKRSPLLHIATNFGLRTFAVATCDCAVAATWYRSEKCIIEANLDVEVNHVIVTEKLGLIIVFREVSISCPWTCRGVEIEDLTALPLTNLIQSKT